MYSVQVFSLEASRIPYHMDNRENNRWYILPGPGALPWTGTFETITKNEFNQEAIKLKSRGKLKDT